MMGTQEGSCGGDAGLCRRAGHVSGLLSWHPLTGGDGMLAWAAAWWRDDQD